LDGFAKRKNIKDREKSCKKFSFSAPQGEGNNKKTVSRAAQNKIKEMKRYKKCHIVDIVLDSEHQVRITTAKRDEIRARFI
jgi:hypothetical protein